MVQVIRIELADALGATPLDPDTLSGLKLSYVATQAALNAAEETNILSALAWTKRSRAKDILNRAYIQSLHQRMFGDVWRWAGTWRKRETTIGIDPLLIPPRAEALLADVRYWITNTVFDRDESAVRLHHQLVLIHPFPNGNGRHTQLMADLLVGQLGGMPFGWGSTNLSAAGDVRKRYIDALRLADRGDLLPLIAFARS